jgi:hypothetical protein
MYKKSLLLLLAIFLLSNNLLVANSGIIPRGKIILDNNLVIAESELMHKLKLRNNAFTGEELSLLLEEINYIVPLNKKRAKHFYFDKFYKNVPFKTIAYGISINTSKKISIVLDNFIKKHKKHNTNYFKFVLSGENRTYNSKDFLTPVLGYTHKVENKNNFTYRKGIRGIENYYNDVITSQSDTANDIYLNIDYDLQMELEKSLFLKKVDIDASEIISIIIEPKTYHIKAFASSNRYNPKEIYKEDYISLEITATDVLFDIGSYLIPIQNAIKNEKTLNLEEGYKKFGFYQKSGIDLNYEKFSKNTLKVNILQLLKMYTVFYANGKIANPSITKQNSQKQFQQIISPRNATEIQASLKQLFQQGSQTITIEDPKKRVHLDNKPAYFNFQEIEFDSNKYLQVSLTIDPKEEYYSDKISFVDIPSYYPFTVIHSSIQGTSSHPHTYHIYSKKTKNLKIGKVYKPINQWQANQRNGSEAIVEGIYELNGNFYIDRITSEGKDVASCNACQEYNVETLQILEDKLLSVSIRDFNIENYKPYQGE